MKGLQDCRVKFSVANCYQLQQMIFFVYCFHLKINVLKKFHDNEMHVKTKITCYCYFSVEINNTMNFFYSRITDIWPWQQKYGSSSANPLPACTVSNKLIKILSFKILRIFSIFQKFWKSYCPYLPFKASEKK